MSDHRDLEPSLQQVLEWAACGIVVAAARFVPVPVLDDVIRDRATRVAVSRTLTAHGRTYPADAVEPLYDPQQRHRGLVRRLAAVPRKILLYPARKYVALLGSVKGVPTDVLTVILLGRAVHRSLAVGLLAGTDEKALRAEALQVRKAFDEARSWTDWRMAAGAVSDGLSGLNHLGRDAVALGQRLARGNEDEVDRRIADDAPVGQGAQQVAEVLRRPEVVAEFDRFDARLDERLAALAAPPVRR